MINNFNLIKRNPSLYGDPPCFDVMKEFEDAIYQECPTLHYINNEKILNPVLHKLLIARLGIPLPKNKLLKKNSDYHFSIQMGPDFGKVLPSCYVSTNTYAYFFDIWPKFFNETEKFLKNSSIKQVFLSSSYATNYFRKKGFINVNWIPEGVSSKEYKYLPYAQKDIDVLELGRKHPDVHIKIVKKLFKNDKKHFYEQNTGESIFIGKESFIIGMARSKISICFPKSITHPNIAGPVNTMTNRYLQSMASKCLVVGTASDEMENLFEYNPVIQLSKDNPAEHILDILSHYGDYHDLIEKNYQNVMHNHTWEKRWESILEIIRG